MGRGNVCVFGPYEGLYYIDNKYIHAFHRVDDNTEIKLLGDLDYGELTSGSWIFDEMETKWNWEDAVADLKELLKEQFPSLADSDKWLSRTETAILENGLFYVAVEDNEWSMAIKLIQKNHPYRNLSGIQAAQYQSYLHRILTALLTMFESVGTYQGAWTSGTISRVDIGMEGGYGNAAGPSAKIRV